MNSNTMLACGRLVGLVAAVFVGGCAPRWHDGEPLHHDICQAGVYGDSLSVRGRMNWPYGFTDYGLKVYGAHDDQGRELVFQSFQIFWMKAMCFEIEFAAPPKDAASVTLDVAFVSRAGLQRIQETLPINWTPRHDYTTQLQRWERESEEPAENSKSKKAI